MGTIPMPAWVYSVWFLTSLITIPIVVILAILGKLSRLSHEWQFALFGFSWISLVIAGINCRDVTIIIITIPSVVTSFVLCVALWTSFASGWSGVATLCYWIGALAVITGAVYFGFIAAGVQCYESTCHGPYTPPRPNVARDLVLWSLPALIVCIGLVLSKQFGKVSIAGVGTILLLLNPAILWMVAWLQPSLGM